MFSWNLFNIRRNQQTLNNMSLHFSDRSSEPDLLIRNSLLLLKGLWYIVVYWFHLLLDTISIDIFNNNLRDALVSSNGKYSEKAKQVCLIYLRNLLDQLFTSLARKQRLGTGCQMVDFLKLMLESSVTDFLFRNSLWRKTRMSYLAFFYYFAALVAWGGDHRVHRKNTNKIE